LLTETSEFGVDFDYDAEAFLGVLTMIVSEYPDAPLSQVWAMIDWEAIRFHGETRMAYQERMDAQRKLRGLSG
jgi:hypothetical protein